MRKVWVYWNLHTNTFSVRDHATGKVTDHPGCLTLTDVTFKVWQGGRRRVMRTGAKNVHAFVCGMWDGTPTTPPVDYRAAGRQVTYNPFKDEGFVYRDDRTPAAPAATAVLTTLSPAGSDAARPAVFVI